MSGRFILTDRDHVKYDYDVIRMNGIHAGKIQGAEMVLNSIKSKASMAFLQGNDVEAGILRDLIDEINNSIIVSMKKEATNYSITERETDE